MRFTLDELPGVVLEVEYDPAAEWLSVAATKTDGSEHASAGLHIETPS